MHCAVTSFCFATKYHFLTSHWYLWSFWFWLLSSWKGFCGGMGPFERRQRIDNNKEIFICWIFILTCSFFVSKKKLSDLHLFYLSRKQSIKRIRYFAALIFTLLGNIQVCVCIFKMKTFFLIKTSYFSEQGRDHCSCVVISDVHFFFLISNPR